MLSTFFVSAFLAVFLGVFYVANLANAIKVVARRGEVDRRVPAGAERPNKVGLSFAALGTMVFFLEATAYAFGVMLGNGRICEHWTFQSCLPHEAGVQLGGAVLMTLDGIGFLWSILERGRRRNVGKLVTWGLFGMFAIHPISAIS